MNKPKMIMLCGLSGSGKSSRAEAYKEKGAIVFSSDRYRENMFNDINDQTHNKEVFVKLHKDLIAALNDGKDVVYDATNLSEKRRKAFLKLLNNIPCQKILDIIATPFETCIARDAMRERTVGKDVIIKQMKQFTYPFDEDWDKINKIFDDGGSSNPNLYVNSTLNDTHDTPYHSETISQHMNLCYFLAKKNNEPKVVVDACRFHDIGKRFTKTFYNNKKEKTKIAHYYNHENVSAYIYFCYDFMDLNTLYLIQNHMKPYSNGYNTWKRKQKNLFLINVLERLHIYDIISSIKEVDFQKV